MEIRRADFQTCRDMGGAIVVFDVLRAFTAAAFALAQGAREIVLARDPEEALALRRTMVNAKIFGEVAGLKPEDFDLPNSPARLAQADLAGRSLIQCTGAGTAATLRCGRAEPLFVASFACARATVRTLRRLALAKVTFVVSGTHCGWDGDEDAACADYIAALLNGAEPDAAPYLARVINSVPGRFLADCKHPEYEVGDLAYCIRLDCVAFAMRVQREASQLVIRASE